MLSHDCNRVKENIEKTGEYDKEMTQSQITDPWHHEEETPEHKHTHTHE